MTGYYVVNTDTGAVVFHEPSQKIRHNERLATADEIAAAKLPKPSSATMRFAELVKVRATGTVR